MANSASRLVTALLIGGGLLLVAGCAVPPSGPGPDMADPAFGGDYLVAVLGDDTGRGQPVGSLQLDTQAGSATLGLTCRTYLGSFTLSAPNVASFTLPGSTGGDCSAEDARNDAATVALFESVTDWHRDGDALILAVDGADAFRLVR